MQRVQQQISDCQQEMLKVETSLQYKLPKALDAHRNNLADTYKNLVFKSKEFMINQNFRLKEIMREVGKNTQMQLQRSRQQLTTAEERLPRECRALLKRRTHDYTVMEGKLQLLSPENVLKRGYSITLKDGKAVTDAAELQAGDSLVTKFYQGEVVSTVKG